MIIIAEDLKATPIYLSPRLVFPRTIGQNGASMANRLINETSPYLLQHAHNPVDWYPWGDEALEQARRDDKPIFLSIGYSACHWCHVMERESFENEEIASLMNEHFINIKVDREERPDLDSIYMGAIQAMTGHGGWPMSVFLTSDGKPFYGGTYFPPEDRHGMPGFPKLLLAVAEGYRSQRTEITEAAHKLTVQLNQGISAPSTSEVLSNDILNQVYQGLASSFDYENGGLGAPPKFPQPMIYEFLLHYHYDTKDERALTLVEMTLESMAKGGMYDQIGGGFHRYSTDAHWLVPHFEKMLYDNALLSRLYLHAYQVTGRQLYRRIAQETLDYILREMRDSTGGFYSAQDADSEGEEGKFFVWTIAQIQEILGPEEGAIFASYHGVTEEGNFEGKNILHVPQEPETVASKLGITVERLEAIIERGKAPLLEEREKRVHPERDDKILTAWNGLALASLAEAASVLGRRDYLDAATINAAFLLGTLRNNGRVLRTYRDGQAKLKGYLEDYAFLAHGLLALYEATFDAHWLEEAHSVVRSMIDLFWDDRQGLLYDTGNDHETLVVRPRDVFDNATPCGSSVATRVLLSMAILTGEPEYNRIAAASLRSVQGLLAPASAGMGNWLSSLAFHLTTPKEIAIIGPRTHPSTHALLEAVYSRYLPDSVLAGGEPPYPSTLPLPLLEDKSTLNGQPTAYVCQNYTCQAPVTDAESLARQLES